MIDEGLTKVLKRRIIASLIDLGLVGGLTALFARSQSEKFEIQERNEAGQAVFAQADADRLGTIARNFNRTQEIGDTLYAFKLIDLIFLTVVGLLLVLLVKVLIPANTGWSFGQKLLGLKVVNDQGQRPTTSQHFSRTVGAVVDLAPYVIPGLLGWIIAKSRPFNQRVGDSSAKTAVISTRSVTADASVAAPQADTATGKAGKKAAKKAEKQADKESEKLSKRKNRKNAVSASLEDIAEIEVEAPTEPGIEIDPAAETTLSALSSLAAAPDAKPAAPAAPTLAAPTPAAPTPAAPVSSTPTPAVRAPESPAERLQRAADAAPAPTNPTRDLEQPAAAQLDASQPETAQAATGPVEVPERVGPTVDLSAIKSPAFEMPNVAEVPAADVPAAEQQPAADVPAVEPQPVAQAITQPPAQPQARAGRPQPMHRSEAERESLFKATAAPAAATPTPAAEVDRKPPPPRHRAVRRDWERPVAEQAPVWGPDSTIDLSAAEATDSGITDSSVTDSPAAAAAGVAAFTSASAPRSQSGGAKEPQWSEEWDSWLYWDAARECWLRHDTTSGRWVPISD